MLGLRASLLGPVPHGTGKTLALVIGIHLDALDLMRGRTGPGDEADVAILRMMDFDPVVRLGCAGVLGAVPHLVLAVRMGVTFTQRHRPS
jgi:hypothetical protein